MLFSQKENHNTALILSNNYSPLTAPAMSDYLEDFLEFRQTSLTTKKTYAKAIRVFISYLSDEEITTPTEETLLAFREHLFNKSLEATTIASYINALKQLFNWLEEKGLYRNIARNIKGAKVNAQYHRKEALTQEQAKSILESLKGDSLEAKRNYAILLLALCCGLRTIEIVRANKEDITLKLGSKVLLIQGKGKLDKADFVKLPAPVEEAIKDYLQERGEAPATAPLFASNSDRNHGERLTTDSISRIIKSSFRGVGLDSKTLTAHSTRHTFITLFLMNGGTLEEARQIARHSSINTTMIYNHALERAKNNGEAKVCSLLVG